MRNEITEVQRFTSRAESLPYQQFEQFAGTLSKDMLNQILQKFLDIKKFYEKNLTIYPEFTKEGNKNYNYSRSKKKLASIKKRGKYIVELINKNN